MISSTIRRKTAAFLVVLLAFSAFAGCLGGDEGGDGDGDAGTGDGGGDGGAATNAREVLSTCLGDGGAAGDGDMGGADNRSQERPAGLTPAAGTPVKLGTLLPITGRLQAFGPGMEKATDLARDQLNEAGGVLNGRPIELVHADSQTDPTQAPQAFNKLVSQDKVPAIVGAASSGVTSTLMTPASEGNVVLITPASTSPALTATKAGGYFFRVPPSDALQGAVMADILERCGLTGTVNTLAVNNDYGKGFVGVMKEAAPVTEEVYYAETGQATFDSEVQRACSGNPDAIVFVGYPGEGSQIMSTAFEQGCLDNTVWLFSEGVFDPAFVENAGADDADNSILAGFGGTSPQALAQVIVGEGITGAQNFAQAYQEAYGSAPGLFSAESYDATVLLALAIQKAGEATGPKIMEALPSFKDGQGQKVSNVALALQLVRAGTDIEWVGPSGEFTWDEENSPTTGVYAIWQVAQDGSLSLAERDIQAGGE